MTRAEHINAVFQKYGTDKYDHNYGFVYAMIPEDIHSLLEIGVADGRSIKAWLELFPQADIVGVDKDTRHLDITDPRFTFVSCDIKYFMVPRYFELVVDDGSHLLRDVLAGWNKLHAKSNYYVIEDVSIPVITPILTGIALENPLKRKMDVLQAKHSYHVEEDNHVIFIR